MSVIDLLENNVYDKNGKKVSIKDSDVKYVGLYFSAHWCNPCKLFTPKLIEFYNKYKNEKKFEIVFVSFDSDSKSFKDYYKDMPWWCFDFESDQRDEISVKFNVGCIPMFIIIDAQNGNVICSDGRTKVQSTDPEGKSFPWG